jgi:hypothetical protein
MNQIRQGDYLPDISTIYGYDPSGSVPHATSLGVVLISQCCDLAKISDSNLPICAAVVRLDGSSASLARSGRQPQFASLEYLGEDLFLDFGVVGPIEPKAIGTVMPLTDDVQRRVLAGRISRRYSRFAYPGSIQPFLGKIQKRLREKSGANGALASCLAQVATLRVEADWSQGPPWAFNIVIVLRDGILGPLGDEVPERESIRILPKDLTATAEQIQACAPEDAQLLVLWQRLGDLLCHEAFKDAPSEIVEEWTAEMCDESDFSYARFMGSVDLDVDDLSEWGEVDLAARCGFC